MQNVTENSFDLINVFGIYENGEWAYEDNYMHFVTEPTYRKAVISFFLIQKSILKNIRFFQMLNGLMVSITRRMC